MRPQAQTHNKLLRSWRASCVQEAWQASNRRMRAEVQAFGSQTTGWSLPGGDLDVQVVLVRASVAALSWRDC